MLPSERYRGREQTWVKHLFLFHYLDRVAYTIGSTFKDLIYVDCFAGPWQAGDDELADTSIRISLEKLNEVYRSLKSSSGAPKMRAIFVEEDPASFARLTSLIKKHQGAVKVTPLQGSFADHIPGILKEVGRSFAFFFVDPTGWTGFPMKTMAPILRHTPGEVMVNFMFDFINRFMNHPEPAIERSIDELFGTTDWHELRHVDNPTEREERCAWLYVDQLKRAGKYPYGTYTRVLYPLADRAYFHLMYTTRNRVGIVKFRDVEDTVATKQDGARMVAHENLEKERSGQGNLLDLLAGSELPEPRPSSGFQRDRVSQRYRAEARLYELLAAGPLAWEILQPRILQERLITNTRLKQIIADGTKAGRLAIDGLRPKHRVPQEGCTIRLIK